MYYPQLSFELFQAMLKKTFSYKSAFSTKSIQPRLATGRGCFGGTRKGSAACSYKWVALIRGLGHLSPGGDCACGLAGVTQAAPAHRAGQPSGVEQGQRRVGVFLHMAKI